MGVTSINVPKQGEGDGGDEGNGKKTKERGRSVMVTIQLERKDKKMFQNGMAMSQLGRELQLSSFTLLGNDGDGDDTLLVPPSFTLTGNDGDDTLFVNPNPTNPDGRRFILVETNSFTCNTTNKNSRKLNKNQRRAGDTRCYQKNNNQSRQLNGSTMRSQKMKTTKNK